MRALNRREKILAVVTAALVLVVAGWFLFSAWSDPLRQRRADKANLAAEVERTQKRLDKSRQAEARLAQFNRRSLPADPEIARSFYQNWLLALGKEAGFRGAKVDVTGHGGGGYGIRTYPPTARQRGGVYRVLRFTVQARATLEKLTEFLYKFYSVDRLHQIRTLSIKPTAGSSDLELTLVIEALSLPDGEPSEPPAAGRLAEYDQYTTAIANRNLFAPHKPAPPPAEKPPAEPGPPKFDPGKYAYLTAIVGVNGRPEVWVISRTSGEKLKLHEGDSFSVGELRGKVIQINRRDAEIEFDGDRGRWLVSMGDNLSDAVKLPDG